MSLEAAIDVKEPALKKVKLVESSDSEKAGEQQAKALKDENGDAYFEISGKRRVAVRTFKGKTLIDIREASR
jgi:hypothetical protein